MKLLRLNNKNMIQENQTKIKLCNLLRQDLINELRNKNS